MFSLFGLSSLIGSFVLIFIFAKLIGKKDITQKYFALFALCKGLWMFVDIISISYNDLVITEFTARLSMFFLTAGMVFLLDFTFYINDWLSKHLNKFTVIGLIAVFYFLMAPSFYVIETIDSVSIRRVDFSQPSFYAVVAVTTLGYFGSGLSFLSIGFRLKEGFSKKKAIVTGICLIIAYFWGFSTALIREVDLKLLLEGVIGPLLMIVIAYTIFWTKPKK
ncbi:MAG TPA: hypothetical protein VI790_03835 [Candidatus Nanoarchaeia archaeon]|nr:hypothetical protein [Candidatus Nanoarchaeia archaeon]